MSWRGKVWGQFGGGMFSKKTTSDGSSYMRWMYNSTEAKPYPNSEDRQCEDPDRTGYCHYLDNSLSGAQNNKNYIRQGTAGHELSQVVELSGNSFLKGWYRIKITGRVVSGGKNFYLRIFEGVGSKGFVTQSVTKVLPGIIYTDYNKVVDQVIFINFDALNAESIEIRNNLKKYLKIAISPQKPNQSGVIDIFNIELQQGF